MTILIGGGTGFVGRHVHLHLETLGHKVMCISRTEGPGLITWNEIINRGLPSEVTTVINFAGENILKNSYHDMKIPIRNSRIDTSEILVNAIKLASSPPKLFISSSAVGYYPANEKARYDEDSICRPNDFISRLCFDWEKAARLPTNSETRQINLRLGIVLSRDGGAINRMFLPFYFGVGGCLGDGQQWFPWIHAQDVSGIVEHVMERDDIKGTINAVAPDVIRNVDFTRSFSSALWRPAFFAVPARLLNYLYGSDRAAVLLKGQHVTPRKLLNSGYQYKFGTIESACKKCSRLLAIDY